MTTPRDDIAGLSERLREESERLSYNSLTHGCATCGVATNLAEEAATKLDALQARVKELEGYQALYEASKGAVIREGDRATRLQQERDQWRTQAKYETDVAQAAAEEIARLKQERDEAYERLKDHLDHLDGGLKLLLAAVKADDPKEEIAWRVEEEMVQAHLVRRLAGPEKEKTAANDGEDSPRQEKI